MEAQSQNHGYTILRIKRKRTEEPLDALVVESRFRQKKPRGGVDVFQFAQTVEHDAWQDNALRKNLESQISRLAQDSNAKPPGPRGRETKLPSGLVRTDNSARRYAVKVTGNGEDSRQKRRPTSPPKVISSKDIPRNDFKMYDAVLEDRGPAIPPMDPEMEKFLPMLQDYLTLQENASSTGTSNTHSHAATHGDYVWDVFYRRPFSLSEWNTFVANVGTVTGLPRSVEHDDLSDNSESQEEDEADEDSNAEEYYKNDYPDEEASDDDDSFSDDTDEEFSSEPADSDHDWR